MTPASPSNELQSPKGQQSLYDTVPNTPLPVEGQDEIFQSFAYLTPFNHHARLAFDHAVDAIKSNPDSFSYALRNMDIEPFRQESASATSVFTDSDTAEADIGPTVPVYRFQGRYHFKLSNPPRNSKKGWALGDGRGSAAQQVDILLSGPKKVPDIAGIHAIIFPHDESCCLVLQARHMTVVHNVPLSQSIGSSQRQLAWEDEIRIGNCVYRFKHDNIAETDEHQKRLEVYMKKIHGPNWESLLPLLRPSSEIPQMTLHAYSWPLGAFAKGTFGVVAAGFRNDGKPVAVKRFNKPKETELSAHRRMMAYIGKHVSVARAITC